MLGVCSICGEYAELTFEHVPPEAAFNDSPVEIIKFEEAINSNPFIKERGRIRQKGSGDYTLCSRCNNLTGKWYASHYIKWCYQGMEILQKTNGHPSLIYINYLIPLRIIKQVITMFFSVNQSWFRTNNLELVEFVLSREKKYLSPKYKIYCYYNIEGYYRRAGLSVQMKTIRRGHELITLSEFNFPPYGFVMTFDSSKPDERLCDITHFANYGYNDFMVFALNIPVLPTNIVLPADYRTKEEIQQAYLRNMLMYPELRKQELDYQLRKYYRPRHPGSGDLGIDQEKSDT